MKPAPLSRTASGLILSVTLLSCLLWPQNPRGTLRGTVQDTTGALIPSASVVIQARGSSLHREATTNSQGQFRLDDLLPGTYRVRVSAKGFAEAQSNVAVIVSSARDITVTMSPAPVQQTVKVKAQPSSITTQPL